MTVVRLKRRLWNGWTTACCWICLDCAYISIQPTRERRSNCQTSTGKSRQTRAPLPASDIRRMEEELLDIYGIGVVWFKSKLQDQARCDDFCIGGVKRTATVTWFCLTAKSQICRNVQTIVTQVTESEEGGAGLCNSGNAFFLSTYLYPPWVKRLTIIIIVIINGGILSLTDSHHHHRGQIATMVGICHGGNKPLGQSLIYDFICKLIANKIFFRYT